MTRAEFLSSKGYWLSTIQLDLYAQLEEYMKEHSLNRTQLAEKLGVTKGYVSQILNGDFDHKISKLIDLALLMGKAPQIEYSDLVKYIKYDEVRHSGVFINVVSGNVTLRNRSTEKIGVVKSEEYAKSEEHSFERRLGLSSKIQTNKLA
jgi:transcriptional regulator with XRE-family HTH domain